MPQTDGESAAGWEPVPGVAPLVERIEFETLDFVAELEHPLRSRILRQMRDPHTIAEVAAVLDVPVTRLYHHVNRLEGAGLIQVVATRKVAAVIERQYQVVARFMGVAPQFLTSSKPTELATALGSVFDTAKVGLQREIEVGAVLQDEDNTVLSLSHLSLAVERKDELMARLEALVEEFAADASTAEADAVNVALFIAAHLEST